MPLAVTGTLHAANRNGAFRVHARGESVSVEPDSFKTIRATAASFRAGSPGRLLVDRFLSTSGLTLTARGPLGRRVWYRPDRRAGPIAAIVARLTGLPVSGFGGPPRSAGS